MPETKITRYGNSLAVRLPAALARELDLRDGDRVRVRRLDQAVIIERASGSRLGELLATVRDQEPEVRTGPARGAERE